MDKEADRDRHERYAEPGVATSDLAVRAAEAALADAGVDRAEVDYVVLATMTPDYYVPGAAWSRPAQARIAHDPVLDIRQQCAGFVHGLEIADALVRGGLYRRVLLIGAEVHGGFMPYRSWDVVLGEATARCRKASSAGTRPAGTGRCSSGTARARR